MVFFIHHVVHMIYPLFLLLFCSFIVAQSLVFCAMFCYKNVDMKCNAQDAFLE
jgi:hypothetical protein